MLSPTIISMISHLDMKQKLSLICCIAEDISKEAQTILPKKKMIETERYEFQPLLFKNIKDRRLLRFLSLLSNEKNLIHPDVEKISSEAFLSYHRIRAICKKETGYSVFEVAKIIAIEKAKHDLIDTTKTISEISYSIGFSALSHFCRIFKNLEGLSPSEYRSRKSIVG